MRIIYLADNFIITQERKSEIFARLVAAELAGLVCRRPAVPTCLPPLRIESKLRLCHPRRAEHRVHLARRLARRAKSPHGFCRRATFWHKVNFLIRQLCSAAKSTTSNRFKMFFAI